MSLRPSYLLVVKTPSAPDRLFHVDHIGRTELTPTPIRQTPITFPVNPNDAPSKPITVTHVLTDYTGIVGAPENYGAMLDGLLIYTLVEPGLLTGRPVFMDAHTHYEHFMNRWRDYAKVTNQRGSAFVLVYCSDMHFRVLHLGTSGSAGFIDFSETSLFRQGQTLPISSLTEQLRQSHENQVKTIQALLDPEDFSGFIMPHID